MRRHVSISLLAAGLLGGAAAQAAEVAGNVGVTSNYIWRGVTQTDDGAAIQGGLDYAHESGLYAGTWLSNVDFGSPDPNADRNEIELDLYGGYGGEVGELGYDVGLIYYAYPLADDADFLELALAGSYRMLTAGVSYTISSDVEDTNAGAEAFIEDDLYYYVSAEFALPQDFGLSATVGQYAFEDDGVAGAELDYTHYRLGIGKAGFELAYEQNDLDGVSASGKDFDDPRFVVSYTKEF
ncbi:MAG: hypothetical protein GWO02_21825 [Gammaproteobacteria bacterium]|nr:hypothetical protein [Gammaproteobacteria bacterium]